MRIQTVSHFILNVTYDQRNATSLQLSNDFLLTQCVQSLQILYFGHTREHFDLFYFLKFKIKHFYLYFVSGQTRSGETAQESEERQSEGQNEQLSTDEIK